MSLKSILKDLLTNTKFSIWGIKEYGKGCYIGARSVGIRDAITLNPNQ
ncbi:hypothetical protein [uncultured Clostridium sp.]|jgi:hypothetical protein|nr:hypothetical protein [uncultured Clostridium sp.]